MKFWSIVATTSEEMLITRLLWSISRAKKPGSYQGIIVIENGHKSNLEQQLLDLRIGCEIKYLFLNQYNKSLALNQAITEIQSDFFCFHDDDIIIDQNALVLYAESALLYGPGFCFGGPVLVERTRINPKWIEARLPSSATGWTFPQIEIPLNNATTFLGANWAAWRIDLIKHGVFDQFLGPAQAGVGQETFIQKKFKLAGVRSIYLDGARSWHYVSDAKSSPEWALDRGYKGGVSSAYIKCSLSQNRWSLIFDKPTHRLVVLLAKVAKAIGYILNNSRVIFTSDYVIRWHSGAADGIELYQKTKKNGN